MRNRTTEGAQPRPPGGASGVPAADGTLAPTPTAASPSPFLGRPAGPKPKMFRVLNGGMVMINNVRATLRAGKEVSSTAYDIAYLRRQGIKLEEIADDSEPTAEPIPPEATAPAAS
jgi:hypothetical protein